MSKTKILYVEDEPALATIVKDTLEGQGYEVSLVSDGAAVIAEYRAFHPDLCLLDVMLPNVDGFTLGQQIKGEFSNTPIIFLTAKNQTADVVKGFKSGGNDYLKKPFSLEELLVRIKNMLSLKAHSPRSNNSEAVAIGKYRYYPNKLLLQYNHQQRTLTHRESEVIKYFAANINGLVDKKKLLLEVWGDDSFYNVRSLDVYIKRLRAYFSEDAQIEIITLRGVGYRFNVG